MVVTGVWVVVTGVSVVVTGVPVVVIGVDGAVVAPVKVAVKVPEQIPVIVVVVSAAWLHEYP